MIESEVLELVARGEDNRTEFKENWEIRPEQLAREIVSFANMYGGHILIGVSDSGGIVGVAKDRQEWLMDTVIGRYVHPSIFINYETQSVTNKKIAVIGVPMGAAKPYVLKQDEREDVYIRFGNICKRATREQQQRLFESGGLLSVEKLPIHGASLDVLEGRRVRQYFCDKLGFDNEWKKGKEDLMMLHSFLIEREDKSLSCSYFACALFAKKPGLWLPQARVRLTVFPGNDKDYDTSMDEILDMPFIELKEDKETGYSERSLADEGLRLLRPHISRDVLDAEVSMSRRRQWDYPPEAIRELIINAYAHRDWTRQNTVEVTVYSDRMEIISPGALPNGMTVEKIKAGERTPRNNKITDIFRHYGLMEDHGMGIRRKVIPLMQRENGCEPIFEATESYFKVVLSKRHRSPD